MYISELISNQKKLKAVLAAITKKIVKKYEPERIILFGSAA
jgi:hypothetical protein